MPRHSLTLSLLSYAQNPDQGSGYGYGYGEGGYGYSYYDDYYLNYEKTAIWPMVLVAPIVTLVVSGLDIALYYKACLHPIYTLILSIFFLIGWIVTFIFNVGYDYTDAYPDSTAAVAIHAIMSACFGILFCAYFAYMVISAVGVNFRRKAKKVGVKPGDGKLRFVADQPAMATAPAEA